MTAMNDSAHVSAPTAPAVADVTVWYLEQTAAKPI